MRISEPVSHGNGRSTRRVSELSDRDSGNRWQGTPRVFSSLLRGGKKCLSERRRHCSYRLRDLCWRPLLTRSISNEGLSQWFD
jgi:hypothetical protein